MTHNLTELTAECKETISNMVELRTDIEQNLITIQKLKDPKTKFSALDDPEEMLASEQKEYEDAVDKYNTAGKRLRDIDNAVYRIADACGKQGSTLEQLKADRETLMSVNTYIQNASQRNLDFIREAERKWTTGLPTMFDSQAQGEQFMQQLIAQQKIIEQNSHACAVRLKECEKLVQQKQVEEVMRPKKTGSKLKPRTANADNAIPEPRVVERTTVEAKADVMESSGPSQVAEQKENITNTVNVTKSIKLKH